MGNLKDITGQKFGRLTVTSKHGTIGPPRQRRATWACRCECGNETVVQGSHLKTGNTKSCGCLGTESKRANACKVHIYNLKPNNDAAKKQSAGFIQITCEKA